VASGFAATPTPGKVLFFPHPVVQHVPLAWRSWWAGVFSHKQRRAGGQRGSPWPRLLWFTGSGAVWHGTQPFALWQRGPATGRGGEKLWQENPCG